jgi:hypothetical protein
MKKNTDPPSTTFADAIAPLVKQLGQARAAEVCGVTVRTIQRWLDGQTVNRATRTGAILLLREAATTSD